MYAGDRQNMTLISIIIYGIIIMKGGKGFPERRVEP